MEPQSDWKCDYRFGMFVIWPEEEVRAMVNKLRQKYDPESRRCCEAHITLTQPFLALPDDDTWKVIEAVAEESPSFSIHFGPIETFADSAVVKFDIEPKPAILELRRRLHNTGLFNLTLPFTEGFIPHMTIAESGLQGPEQANYLARELNEKIGPGHFLCSGISHIRPDALFHFDTVRSVLLGGVC